MKFQTGAVLSQVKGDPLGCDPLDQYKKKASKSARMAFNREQNNEIHKGGTSKTRRKAKKGRKI